LSDERLLTKTAPRETPVPDVPVPDARQDLRLSVEDFEAVARSKLPRMVYDYYAGAAGDEWTLAENRRAFDRWVLRPRVLNDVSNVSLETSLLGTPLAFPIALAPTAFQRLAHREGELATARAAASLGTLMVLSTISTTPLEDVAATGVTRWFQLYVMKDHAITESLLERAVAAGYGAVVVTVDTPWLGRRLRDERNEFSLPPGIGMANLRNVRMPKGDTSGSKLASFFATDHDAALSWKDLEWIRSKARVPLALKGVVTAEDARIACEHGVECIVVSNHGGRQLDGCIATLDALSEVVEAVDGRCEVLVDGGVRRGSDALKALALGAKAVLIGRPYLWGLAADGEAGVRRVLEMLRDELSLAMSLSGAPDIASIDRALVRPAPGTSA
jgi:4-hydroxymandelate oxidase